MLTMKPPPRVAKRGERLVRAIEGAVEIEVDIAMPLFGGHFADLFEAALAGVVDQDVEPAEFAIDGSEEGAHAPRGG